MNPLSSQALARRLSSARQSDGLLTTRTRRRRDQWRSAVNAQDAGALLDLSRGVSLTEQWELVAGCGSVWAWNQVLSWGNEPNTAAFDGFVDALNTAESAEHRASLWAVWPTLLDLAGSQKESWLKYIMHSLGQVEVWAQGEPERLNLARLLPNNDWQVPFQVYDIAADDPLLTPLQYAWQKGNPGLCRMFLEGGADAHALSPESWWPGWSLARVMEGVSEGKDLSSLAKSMSGPDQEAFKSLGALNTMLQTTLAIKGHGGPWEELMSYQRALDRRQALEKDLPAATPTRKGPRF